MTTPNKRTLGAIALGASLLVFGACGDEDPNPTASIAEFSPTSLDSSDDTADDLTIRVDYADGDGDLGEGTAEVHDCRVADLVIAYDLPKIASDEAVEAGVAIEGSIDIVVADVSVLPVDSSAPSVCADLGAATPADGEAVFCVVLVDTAGNSGDGDCTGAITIQ